MDKYNIYQFAQLIGVSDRTLRRWDNEGTFCAFRTPAGRPYYTDTHYLQYSHSDSRFIKNKSKNNQAQGSYNQVPPTAC